MACVLSKFMQREGDRGGGGGLNDAHKHVLSLGGKGGDQEGGCNSKIRRGKGLRGGGKVDLDNGCHINCVSVVYVCGYQKGLRVISPSSPYFVL